MRVLLERGDFVFIPLGSHHQSFYEFGATRILNVGISKRFFIALPAIVALLLCSFAGIPDQ